MVSSAHLRPCLASFGGIEDVGLEVNLADLENCGSFQVILKRCWVLLEMVSSEVGCSMHLYPYPKHEELLGREDSGRNLYGAGTGGAVLYVHAVVKVQL